MSKDWWRANECIWIALLWKQGSAARCSPSVFLLPFFPDPPGKFLPVLCAGEPDDVAFVVAFLATDEAGWITGSLIDTAGGVR